MSAAPDSTRASVPARCDNCAEALDGLFCSACGQKAEPLRQPAHHFVRDSVAEFFGLDGRVWRTLWNLLFKPGSLTIAYLSGRRQRFLRPLRVYLSSTLLFFVLLSLIDPVGKIRDMVDYGRRDSDTRTRVSDHMIENDTLVAQGIAGMIVDRDDVRDEMVDLISEDSVGGVSEQAIQIAVIDSVTAAIAEATPDELHRAEVRLQRARVEASILHGMPPDSLVHIDDIHDAVAVLYPDTVGIVGQGNEWFIRSEALRRVTEGQTTNDKVAGIAAFSRAAIGYVPTVMFLLLPLFALLMKAFYVRRSWFYSEHLVFGLHTHAFAFVVFALVTLFVWAGGSAGSGLGSALSWAVGLLLASIPVYFFIAQKRVYKQGWGKTLLKTLLLGAAYNTLIGIGIVAALLLAALIG